MKVNSDELTETEKDLIDIYGEARILKVIWCYENDASIRQLKQGNIEKQEKQKMEQNPGAAVTENKFVK